MKVSGRVFTKVIFLVLLLVQPLWSQEAGGAPASEESAAPAADADADKAAEAEKKAEEEKEKLESLIKEKRETLLYGIDTEVLDLLSTIKSEKDMTFNEDLAGVLDASSNAEIQRGIIEFFNEMEVDLAEEHTLQMLTDHLDDYDFSNRLLLAAVSYLGTIKSEEAGDLFYNLLTDNSSSLAVAALRGIGRLEDSSRVEEILDLVNEYEGDSEYDEFLAAAMTVLGELGYQESQILLEDILQDEDAPSAQRQNAAVAIGLLGNEEGLTLLRDMYNSSQDSLLRSYILLGITKYEDPSVETILINALRDSFWRIRVAAAQGLGEREAGEAVDILQYKVRKDPIRHVRYASLEALGQIGGSDADDFILEMFEGERVAFDIRQKALDMMMEHRISGSIDALEEVLRPKWSADNDSELGPFCKTLSTTEWDRLRPFYAEMLAHKDFVIRIYGIRGVRLNKISGLKDALKAMDNEKEAVNVRREAQAALESF